MAATSPTQRTLKAMKDLGRVSGIVERFNPYAGQYGIRQDLFGFIDIICMCPKECDEQYPPAGDVFFRGGIVAVQSFGQDWSGHVKKLHEERADDMKMWLQCGGRLELWGWRKLKAIKKDGTKGAAMRWQPRIGDVKLSVSGEIEVHERKR